MENVILVCTIIGGIASLLGILAVTYKVSNWWIDRRNRSAGDPATPVREHIADYEDADDDEERLSRLEVEILVAMSKPNTHALISWHQQAPRHLQVAGKIFVDENDDLYRLEGLEAVEHLLGEEYIDEVGDDVFCITASGTRLVRSLS